MEVSVLWQFVALFWGDKCYISCVVVAGSDESDPSLSSEFPSSSSRLPWMLFRECAILQANKSLIGEQFSTQNDRKSHNNSLFNQNKYFQNAWLKGILTSLGVQRIKDRWVLLVLSKGHFVISSKKFEWFHDSQCFLGKTSFSKLIWY